MVKATVVAAVDTRGTAVCDTCLLIPCRGKGDIYYIHSVLTQSHN
jgi:hypothetical protein